MDYATIWGYQFGVRTELSKVLFWTVHWSHPFGMDSQGHALRHASPFNATSQLVYRKKKWTATLTGRYNGEMSHDELSFSERNKTHIYAINENGQTYSLLLMASVMRFKVFCYQLHLHWIIKLLKQYLTIFGLLRMLQKRILL